MQTFEIIISGKVQGVFFRATIKKYIDSYNLNTKEEKILGSIENLADGTVRIVASSDDIGLSNCISYAIKGSPLSNIININISILKETVSFNDFRILR